ncbi:hypothetical protein [Mucilaginibacter sp.]|jgi:hypothetical protein|uniref:hypothetical protein n=1 Tax=Mucilaginibacter sp. TaxID=1882438 RepID=UPI003567E2B9
MALSLSNKNIILISPRYFNYEKEVKTELEKRGAFVYFIDDRMKNSTVNKALFRLKLKEKLDRKRVFDYFKGHLDRNIDKKIDYLIAIIPEGFSKDILEYYKAQLKKTVFILYMWDSIDNRPYIIDTLSLYDKKFTFDKSNAIKYGLTFRPLFYTDEYKKIGFVKKDFLDYKYALSFIGTAHSDRYNVVQKLIGSSKRNLSTFFFFYLQNPILIIYYRIVDPKFRNIKVKDFSFKGLSKQEVVFIIENSLCIIDINHPRQTGLTIRSIEVLGAKRKLITTNHDIKNYDFYDPGNILLVDRDNPILDDAFLKKPYQDIEQAVYDKYSISQWVNDLLTIN